MRGKRAKDLRKQVYGEDFSPRDRKYIIKNGAIKNIGLRAIYQELKKTEIILGCSKDNGIRKPQGILAKSVAAGRGERTKLTTC